MNTIRELEIEKLKVKVYATRKEMGEAAAGEMVAVLRQLLEEKEQVNMIFAAAPSQNEFFEGLIQEKGIAWERVNAFHMDEYVGLDGQAPQGFGNFLRDRIFSKLPLRSVYYLNGNAKEPLAECERYTALLQQYPVDIVCMGIGENGHIAFNDPHVAQFQDPKWVKLVALDPRSREQQVHDGCFMRLEEVPTHALTLTIPCLVAGKYLFCMVPDAKKAKAVAQTIGGAVSEQCPASILRRQEHATLYLDQSSAAGL